MPPTGEAPEFLNTFFRIVSACEFLQIVAYKLIEALAHRLCLLSRADDKLLVDR
jgi:hypothetical protein